MVIEARELTYSPTISQAPRCGPSRTTPRPEESAESSLACLGASALPFHRLGGELLHPHALAAALAEARGTPLAYLGTSNHGLYELLAARGDIEKLPDRAELTRWAALHPGGLVLAASVDLGSEIPAGLALVTREVVHHKPVLVLRAGSAGPGAR